MPADTPEDQIRKHREKFVQAFDDLALATSNIAAMSKKQIEIMNKQIEATNKLIDVTSGLIETMMMPKDGMRDVIDEMLEEVRGLRDDMLALAKAGGFSTALAALMGRGPRDK